MRKVFTVLCLLFLAQTAAADPSPPLKIGGVLHVTGEFSIQGEAFREGMELGAEAVRESLGIPVQLIIEDTQYSAVRALTVSKKLLAVDKVHAAIISTAVEAKASGQSFQLEKVPAIVLWDSSPELEAIGNYVFSIGPWIPSSGERMANFALSKLNAKSAAVIHSNTEWSAAVAKAFQSSFEKSGGNIVFVSGENPGEADFRTTLMKAKRKAPDVLYVPVDANLIAFFAQIKQLAFQMPLLTSDIITEDNLQEAAPSFEGIYQSMPAAGEAPLSEDLLKRYQRRFGKPCTQVLFVAWGFDAVRLVADAFHRSGFAGGEKLQAALRATKDFPGASNTITINERGTAATPLHVFRVEKGAFKKLD